MSGYVRIHRSLLGHPAFRNDAEAMAFAWLVAKAAWQPTRVRYKERIIALDRGQLAVSVRDFATAMDRDKAWVERLLKRLKAETMVETRHETGVNVITICNYEEYQARGLRHETVDETATETGARQGRDTEQVREELKKVSSVAKATSRRAAYPPPPGVPSEIWTDYLKVRKAKMSDTAYRRQLSKLTKLAEDGYPPGEVVAQSVEHGWPGFYPLKADRNERTDPTFGALAEFQQLVGNVRAGPGVGEVPQAGGPNFDGSGGAARLDRFGGGRA